MIYFICAFKGEARPFIEKRKLKPCLSLPYPFYKNKDTLLLITGMGYQNASKATAELMQYRPPEKGDSIINIGVCAAPEYYPIGSILIAKELRYKKQSVKIEITISHPFKEVILKSVDTVQNHPCDTPVDMEAFGIHNTALAYIDSDRIFIIKVVSDHFKPKNTNIKEMVGLIKLKADEIELALLLND